MGPGAGGRRGLCWACHGTWGDGRQIPSDIRTRTNLVPAMKCPFTGGTLALSRAFRVPGNGIIWREITMEKKIAGLVGAVAALGTLATVQATPAPASPTASPLEANSYADLLQPIPNAVALLKVVDERSPASEANVQLAQAHHHHHHHHHSHARRRPAIVIGRHHHHHHHHHHHNDR